MVKTLAEATKYIQIYWEWLLQPEPKQCPVVVEMIEVCLCYVTQSYVAQLNQWGQQDLQLGDWMFLHMRIRNQNQKHFIDPQWEIGSNAVAQNLKKGICMYKNKWNDKKLKKK